jgi:hypothetical protein
MATILSSYYPYPRSRFSKNLSLVLTPLTLMMKSPSIDLEASRKLLSLRSHDVRDSAIFSDDQMPRCHSGRRDHLQSQIERPHHSQSQCKFPTKLSSVLTQLTFKMKSPSISHEPHGNPQSYKSTIESTRWYCQMPESHKLVKRSLPFNKKWLPTITAESPYRLQSKPKSCTSPSLVPTQLTFTINTQSGGPVGPTFPSSRRCPWLVPMVKRR